MAVTGTGMLGGRYLLAGVLGAGGMATVWRARDEVLGREVAVKVLSPQYAADPGFLARFEREARHAAAVSHPRLVTVFDSGIDGGTPFLVMELVTGRTLRQVLDEAGALPAGQAVAVAAAVCEGLEAAHAAGLVHRDITPANIMLAGGEVKVLDFGIARAGGTAAGTATGTVLGTAAYLSPEQAAGYPAGPASDLYALGCVLFEMLAGVPPFTAESQVGIAYRQVHDDPGVPSARRPGLPASLDQITARLLAKDPADRPASAAAARAGLLAALASDATAVLPVPPGTVSGASRRWRRPRRGETVLAVALAVALAALAAVLAAGLGSDRPAAPTAQPAVTGPASHAPAGRPRQSSPPHRTPAGKTAAALPPVAAAAAALVGALQAGVADGQVTQQAGQDLFSRLQPLLFGPPGQDTRQIQDQYAQLVKSYAQHQSKGDITGQAAVTLSRAIAALGNALGAG
ncbi:MAG TPA: protein kinase [Streptosporangiaceae bacterium]|nr:protein kinase [Streptosporangiaceae bacterium]